MGNTSAAPSLPLTGLCVSYGGFLFDAMRRASNECNFTLKYLIFESFVQVSAQSVLLNSESLIANDGGGGN